MLPTEVERLFDAFPSDLPSRLRCLAIMRCVVDLGLRRSEVVALEFSDIDWASPTFAALVQEFFGPYLLLQRSLSPRTVRVLFGAKMRS
ncbi:hypothetical protein OOZ63_20195 [Paucibacter sp. PLA-PC-4]|uniref:hypothetical protein n=1 Tax=Paucibacter sp. PLA-PC-4 TaxID=2993655 RepID=UPI00224B48D8|nr:hypothetical protein [Paucibacter sp. PLA-PC-4]MCX2864153.1 hypothetical protein [Paucibacter sp. PLA-PC-4]